MKVFCRNCIYYELQKFDDKHHSYGACHQEINNPTEASGDLARYCSFFIKTKSKDKWRDGVTEAEASKREETK